MLTKSKCLAYFLWQIDDRVAFSYGDAANPDFFYMDAFGWHGMGKPKTITISIEPGDSLHGI